MRWPSFLSGRRGGTKVEHQRDIALPPNQRVCPVCGRANWWWAYYCGGCGYLEPSWNQAHRMQPWPLEPKYFEPLTPNEVRISEARTDAPAFNTDGLLGQRSLVDARVY